MQTHKSSVPAGWISSWTIPARFIDCSFSGKQNRKEITKKQKIPDILIAPNKIILKILLILDATE